MKPTISLHEYRLASPNSDRVPTITQMGLIGPILLRQHRKAVRIARRRAARERVLSQIASALIWLWRKVTAPAETAPTYRVHDIRNLKTTAAYVDR
jgi:hypothetical protein